MFININVESGLFYVISAQYKKWQLHLIFVQQLFY